MWAMLLKRGQKTGGVSVTFRDVEAVGENGAKAHWDARYTFGATGNKVLNSIDSRFVINADGLIAEQVDTFDFWTWASQALGVPGKLMGWFPPFHHAVQRKARQGLDEWMARGKAGEAESPAGKE